MHAVAVCRRGSATKARNPIATIAGRDQGHQRQWRMSYLQRVPYVHPSLGVLDAKDHSPIGGLIVLFGKENKEWDVDQDVAVRGKEACDLYLPRPTPHMDRLFEELAQLPDCCC